jgi:hypothetical protein
MVVSFLTCDAARDELGRIPQHTATSGFGRSAGSPRIGLSQHREAADSERLAVRNDPIGLLNQENEDCIL